MKKAMLTVDIEEWYHLEYLDSVEEDRQRVKMVPAVLNLLDLLDEYSIKAVFFVLADIAEEYFDILCEIKDRGHEIGCHGYDHRLLHEMSDEEFSYKAREAKEKLEKLLGKGIVKGYRASCFSLNRSKLDVLKDLGYVYDSSYIRFAEHPLYGEIDMRGYAKEQSLVYSNSGFYEFEIPTLRIFGRNIPISGGGYLRLFPVVVTKALIRKFFKENDNILFYLHPFELTERKIPFSPGIGVKSVFRASVGRKRNMKKLKKIIDWLLGIGVKFVVPSDLIEQYGMKDNS